LIVLHKPSWAALPAKSIQIQVLFDSSLLYHPKEILDRLGANK
jgi:hypothetical protein